MSRTSTKPRTPAQQAAHDRFMRPIQPDVKLATIVGSSPLPRPQIVKRIWDHIKEHELQDAENRKLINLDNALRPIFDGRSQVSMLEIGAAIKAHTQPVAEG